MTCHCNEILDCAIIIFCQEDTHISLIKIWYSKSHIILLILCYILCIFTYVYIRNIGSRPLNLLTVKFYTLYLKGTWKRQSLRTSKIRSIVATFRLVSSLQFCAVVQTAIFTNAYIQSVAWFKSTKTDVFYSRYLSL